MILIITLPDRRLIPLPSALFQLAQVCAVIVVVIAGSSNIEKRISAESFGQWQRKQPVAQNITEQANVQESSAGKARKPRSQNDPGERISTSGHATATSARFIRGRNESAEARLGSRVASVSHI